MYSNSFIFARNVVQERGRNFQVKVTSKQTQASFWTLHWYVICSLCPCLRHVTFFLLTERHDRFLDSLHTPNFVPLIISPLLQYLSFASLIRWTFCCADYFRQELWQDKKPLYPRIWYSLCCAWFCLHYRISLEFCLLVSSEICSTTGILQYKQSISSLESGLLTGPLPSYVQQSFAVSPKRMR